MIIAVLLQTSLELGLLYTLTVLGATITMRILRLDDLTIEGSFSFGAALTAYLLRLGVPPFLTIIGALSGGIFTGLLTSILYNYAHISTFFSGLIVSTAFFSVNLWLVTANAPLMGISTIFSPFTPILGNVTKIIVLTCVAASAYLLFRWFLQTQVGLVLRAAGENPELVRRLGKPVGFFIALGLMIANSMYALAGCLYVQYMGLFSIWSSIGILVVATSGLLLGHLLRSTAEQKILSPFLVYVGGSCGYQLLIGVAIMLSPFAEWNNALRALLLVGIMQLNRWRTRAYIN